MLELACRELRAGFGERNPAQQGHRLCGQRVHRCPSNDTVVVIRVTLHFHQRLTAAGRAALKVSVLLSRTVVLRNDGLTGCRHHVNSVVREVVNRGGAGSPTGVPGGGRLVTGVCLRCGISLGETGYRSFEAHVSCPTSSTEPEQLAVPVVRQAINHADVRALHRSHHSSHFAKRRCLRRCVRGNLFCAADRCVWEAGGRQLRTSGLSGRRETRSACKRTGGSEHRRDGYFDSTSDHGPLPNLALPREASACSWQKVQP